MADELGNVRKRPLKTLVGTERNRTIAVPLEQIIVDDKRRRIDDANVRELMKSIGLVGLLHPIGVTRRAYDDGRKEYPLVIGGHRLEACSRLGWPTIPCTVLELDQAIRVELAEIDENFIRNDPSPAEHALLTGRRREIILELAAQERALSQNATALNEGEPGVGEKTGRIVGSVRDQSDKTGESKDKIHRSTTRFDKLGPAILKSIVGTSLDTGVELNALMKLPCTERDELAKRASMGQAVTARKPRLKTEREKKEEPLDDSALTEAQRAMEELVDWINKYAHVWKEKGLSKRIDEIFEELCEVLFGRLDAPEVTSEPTKKRKWFPRIGRKDD